VTAKSTTPTESPGDWRTYTAHPATSMWPMASAEEYEDLKASIAATGLAVPILMNGTYGQPGTKAWRLREWFHAAILRHQAAGTLPTTPKFLIYEAVSDKVIPKKAPGTRRYDQDSGEAITWLRETGLVPWEWIVDRTRHIADHLGWSSLLAAARAVAETARLDPWRGRAAPLLVVESESLAGLLDPLADRYQIVLVPVRGQAGGAYLVNDVRPYVERGHTEVLYVGDWDKAGADIEASARDRLEHHAGRALTWTRLALTGEQVAAHDLPRIERYDGRDRQTREVCECEAMPQAILLDLVETAVRDRLPAPLDRVQEREARERRAVRRRLG
jgi:hypothetical protein